MSFGSKPTYTNPKSSSDLTSYIKNHGIEGYSSLQNRLLTTPNGRTALGRLQSQTPLQCSLCSGHRGRLYLYLVCAVVSFSTHAAAHATSNSDGHEIIVDVERVKLFYNSCPNQVYDPNFDTAVMAKQIMGIAATAGGWQGQRREAAEQLAVMVAVAARDRSGLPWGLRGLNNLGNTCFMNSVL